MDKDPQLALILIGIIATIWFLRTAYYAIEEWRTVGRDAQNLSPLAVSDGTILGDLFADHSRNSVMTCRVDCACFDPGDGGRCICGDGIPMGTSH